MSNPVRVTERKYVRGPQLRPEPLRYYDVINDINTHCLSLKRIHI